MVYDVIFGYQYHVAPDLACLDYIIQPTYLLVNRGNRIN